MAGVIGSQVAVNIFRADAVHPARSTMRPTLETPGPNARIVACQRRKLASGSSSFHGDSQVKQQFPVVSSFKSYPHWGEKARKHIRQWRMEVADPLENFRDSFGNECAVERKARKDLEMSDSYKVLSAECRLLEEKMAASVAREEYDEAGRVRDELITMELRKKLLEFSSKPKLLYRVGDVVIHRKYGYRGVIYGHDLQCSAPSEWQEAMKIELLARGQHQPFYHILVDTRDRPGGMSTYVAQENLTVPKEGKPVLHPWITKFFNGFEDGTYIPGSKLRQVYPNDW